MTIRRPDHPGFKCSLYSLEKLSTKRSNNLLKSKPVFKCSANHWKTGPFRFKTLFHDHDLFTIFKRFIVDILIKWTGTEKDFDEFMTKINNLHETIKFSHSYCFKNKSTTFLDMAVSIAKK
jgi:hypothetical protein